MELNELLNYDEIRLEKFYMVLLDHGLVVSDLEELSDEDRRNLWNLLLILKLL